MESSWNKPPRPEPCGLVMAILLCGCPSHLATSQKNLAVSPTHVGLKVSTKTQDLSSPSTPASSFLAFCSSPCSASCSTSRDKHLLLPRGGLGAATSLRPSRPCRCRTCFPALPKSRQFCTEHTTSVHNNLTSGFILMPALGCRGRQFPRDGPPTRRPSGAGYGPPSVKTNT